jgi:hypothetical protein
MADEGLKALEGELPGAVPDGLRGLSDEQLRDLAGAVGAARHRQAAALAAAGENALGHVPKLLRIPLRKVMS